MLRLAYSRRLVGGIVRYAASFSTSSPRRTETENGDSKKIYEFRTYAIRPDKFGEYMNMMEENIHLRTAHSRLLGFWVSDLGGINEVNHLWEYSKSDNDVWFSCRHTLLPRPYDSCIHPFVSDCLIHCCFI